MKVARTVLKGESGGNPADLLSIASLWVSAMTDCEVDGGVYEVGLHDMGCMLTFAADYKRNYSGKAA